MNLAHAAGAAFFLWALRRWLGGLTDRPAVANGAFALTLFSGGFGALLDLFHALRPASFAWTRFPTGSPGIFGAADLWSFDLVTFSNVLHYPLAPAALGLLFFALAKIAEPGRAAPWIAGACAGALFLVHPYDAVIAWSLAPAFLFFSGAVPEDRPRRLIAFYLPGVPFALAAFAALKANPVLAEYSAALRAFDVPWTSYLAGLAPLLPPALAGAALALRERRARGPLLWSAAGLALLATPFPLAFKLAHGLHAALCFLAARGLAGLAEQPWPRRRAALAAAFALLALGLGTNLRLWREDVENAAGRLMPFFLPAPLAEALEHLDRAAPEGSLVLSTRRLGLFVPPRTGCRVYAGHWDQTPRLAEKEHAIESVLGPAADDAARRRFLADVGVDYLLLSPRHLGSHGPRWDASPFLKKIFDNGGYRIYEVLA